MIGRTIFLIDSIRIRNGFNQSGAPDGRRWARNIDGEYEAADKIRASHIGSASDRVNKRCLEILNI